MNALEDWLAKKSESRQMLGSEPLISSVDFVERADACAEAVGTIFGLMVSRHLF